MSRLVPLESNRHCLDHHSYWGIRIVVIIAQGILNCPAIGWVSSHSFHHGPWQKRLTSMSTQLNLETSYSYPYSSRVTPFREISGDSAALWFSVGSWLCFPVLEVDHLNTYCYKLTWLGRAPTDKFLHAFDALNFCTPTLWVIAVFPHPNGQVYLWIGESGQIWIIVLLTKLISINPT